MASPKMKKNSEKRVCVSVSAINFEIWLGIKIFFHVIPLVSLYQELRPKISLTHRFLKNKFSGESPKGKITLK